MSDSSEQVPITPEQYDIIADIQQTVLAMLVENAPVTEIFETLCRLAESVLTNAVSSIMIKDHESGLLNVLCAPSIPPEGCNALAGLKPGPGGGSCGNAVFRNHPQFVLNTFEDKRWSGLRHIAYDFNLCSCWSVPIRSEKNEAVGSFALSSFEHRSPAPFHKKLLEACSAIVSIVLKREYRESRIQLFSMGLNNANEGVIITDKNNHILEVNPAFTKIYGYSQDEVIGQNPNTLSSGLHSEIFYQDLWKELLATDKWQGEIRNHDKNGSLITQWMSISITRDTEGNIQNYFSIFSDLTELKNAQQKVVDMAYVDSVTHLHNSNYLEQKVLADNQTHSLLLLNINNFSYINNSYGLDAGDELLKVIAKDLANHFNAIEAFRLNSDEFALLFSDNVDFEKKIQEIQSYFCQNLVEVDGVGLHISFNYGAATGNEDLLRNCSVALKEAKKTGKNRYCIFDGKTEGFSKVKHDDFLYKNNLLRESLNLGQMVPYFQGIRDNKTQTITKFEVLARIVKDSDVLSPYHFIEQAKLAGLLPEITRVMIDKSFRIMKNNNASFSLNITEDDLSQSYLQQYLMEKASEHDIDPSRVTLEILEGVSAVGKKNHIAQLAALKSLGYSLAIDDFGTEYSNFERILELDIDYLKIDAKYIKNIDTSEKSYEIARAISFFAQNVNIPCIAEFVHNQSVQDVVESLGIDYSQGYQFSEPTAEPTIR